MKFPRWMIILLNLAVLPWSILLAMHVADDPVIRPKVIKVIKVLRWIFSKKIEG